MTWKEYMAAQKAEEEARRAEYEARMKASADKIAALKARRAMLEQEIAAEERRLGITDCWFSCRARQAHPTT